MEPLHDKRFTLLQATVIPDIILNGLMCLVLGFMGFTMLQKAIKKKKELSEESPRRSSLILGDADGMVLSGSESEQEEDPSDPAGGGPAMKQALLKTSSAPAKSKEENSSPESTTSTTGIGKALLLFLPLWILVLVLVILKGGGDFHPLGLSTCSAGWWTLSLVTLPVCVVALLYYRCVVLDQNDRKDLSKTVGKELSSVGAHEHHTIHWDRRNTLWYPLICSLAGLFAGLFGVGGGIVKGPLMLALNVDAQIAAATAATMIFFTSSTATVSFALFGDLEWSYAVPLFCLGILCTLLGQIIAMKLGKVGLLFLEKFLGRLQQPFGYKNRVIRRLCGPLWQSLLH